MEVTPSADLGKQVAQELAGGPYRSGDELIEQAVDEAAVRACIGSRPGMTVIPLVVLPSAIAAISS